MFSRFVATLGLVDAYLNTNPQVLIKNSLMENIRFILIFCLLCPVFDKGFIKTISLVASQIIGSEMLAEEPHRMT